MSLVVWMLELELRGEEIVTIKTLGYSERLCPEGFSDIRLCNCVWVSEVVFKRSCAGARLAEEWWEVLGMEKTYRRQLGPEGFGVQGYMLA